VSTAAKTTEQLSAWSKRLSERDMPVFAHTAQRISALTVQDDSSLTELVQTILQDSLMTARVLKVANSVYYQPGRGAISTIGRAVVVMGFETVRALALSVSLVESLGSGVQRERVAREVARAFHAALHAKSFAVRNGDENADEVYTAALLHRLGHMVFWAFGGPQAERLEAVLRRSDMTPHQAEQEVLGFRLDDLSSALAAEWRLGELLVHAYQGDGDPRVKAITLSHRLVRSVEQGWNGRELKPLLGEIGGYGMPWWR